MLLQPCSCGTLRYVFACHRHMQQPTDANALQNVHSEAFQEPWTPYGAAHTENLLFSCLPGTFYRVRWAVMQYNPLCWQFPGRTFTFGELAMLICIVGQIIWMTIVVIQNEQPAVKMTGTPHCGCRRAWLTAPGQPLFPTDGPVHRCSRHVHRCSHHASSRLLRPHQTWPGAQMCLIRCTDVLIRGSRPTHSRVSVSVFVCHQSHNHASSKTRGSPTSPPCLWLALWWHPVNLWAGSLTLWPCVQARWLPS